MAFIHRPSCEGQAAWRGGYIAASKCSNRCCSMSCKKHIVSQSLLSSTPIWAIRTQLCVIKPAMSNTSSRVCAPAVNWCLLEYRDISRFYKEDTSLALMLPALPGSCLTSLPWSTDIYRDWWTGKEIYLTLGNVFKDIWLEKFPQEEVTFGWIVQHRDSFSRLSLDKSRKGTMWQFVDYVWKVSHSGRKSSAS